MKITFSAGSSSDAAELAEELNDLMADLEDVRDDAQELLDEKGLGCVRAAIEKIDAALGLLSQAADALEQPE